MNATMRQIVAAAGVALTVAAAVGQTPTGPVTTGRVLMLDSDRLIEGEIERVGERFRVQREGGETWLPARPEYVLLADRIAAYRLMQSKANLSDPKERLRLAQWCHRLGMRSQAADEATAAADLRPNDMSLKRYRDDLRELAAGSPSRPPAPKAPAQLAEETATVNVRPEALRVFVVKVQPIVMNACANCHTGHRGGRFNLIRVEPGMIAGPKATQSNLSAVVAQLNGDNLGDSRLLQMALKAHGGAKQPPFPDRQNVAYRQLEDWARTAFAAPPIAAAKATPAKKTTDRATDFASPANDDSSDAPPIDAFDPVIFNRAAHPKKK